MMGRRNIGQCERLALKKAWSNACAYCEKPVDAFEIDHIVAHARGGTCDLENLCVTCPSCNRRKSATPLPQFYEGLLLSLAKKKAYKIRGLLKVRHPRKAKCPARAVFGNEYFKKHIEKRAKGNTHCVTTEALNEYVDFITRAAKERHERFG